MNIRRPVFVIAFALAIGFLLAQATFAQTSPEARANGLARALATGEAETIHAFLLDNLAPATLAKRSEGEWRKMAGRMAGDFKKFEVTDIEIGPDEVTLGGRRPSGPPLQLQLGIDAGGKFSSIGVQMGGPAERRGPPLPPLELSKGMTVEQTAAALATFFDRVEKETGFAGTALVAFDGKPIFETARGLANRQYGAPNTAATRFDLGSINKSFTRVAIGQLLAAGKLRLDDTVARHLPDYPNQEVAKRITIAQLLNHSSGLGDIFGPRFRDSSKVLYTTPASFFPLFADQPLQFEPGTGRSYSNGAYMVLGAIIEAVSGESYHGYVAKHVFEPAGMKDAAFVRSDEPVPNVATGYTVQDGRGDNPEHHVRSNVHILPVIGNSAGSAYATSSDLLAFDRALRERRLLPIGYTAWYFDDEVAEETTEQFLRGYGTGIAGGAPGVSAVMESEGTLTVVVLSNFDEPGAEAIGKQVFRSLAGVR